MRVVETVDPDRFAAGGDALEPASPSRFRDAALDRLCGDPPEQRPQLARGAHRERHVVPLKVAGQRRRVFVLDDDEATAELRRSAAQNIEHDRVGVGCQHDGATMNDASLLRGNLAKCRAEEFGVIEADGSDERGDRPDDVRGVEPSAHADFQNDDLASSFAKGDESDCRKRLEVRRRDADAF